MKLSDWHRRDPIHHPKLHDHPAAFVVGIRDVMSIESIPGGAVVTMKNGDQFVVQGPGVGMVRPLDGPVQSGAERDLAALGYTRDGDNWVPVSATRLQPENQPKPNPVQPKPSKEKRK